MNEITTLEYIIKTCQEEQFTAYSIAKDLNISVSAVRKILNGETKNPSKGTIELIRSYLVEKTESKYVAIKNDNNLVNEAQPAYVLLRKPQTQLEISLSENIVLLKTNLELLLEINKLKKILDENKIKY